ncbi:MAG: efflux transporter periplasmic adaptor subunit [Lysobacterales bacterium CG02_land_8_20_14_3_00_62_12]|nr:MAG: efflux transporter periplasmic adaptor subunit [Xanthomonadales bacterium CG02_land_8_20_14_3_00_62_12]
MKPALALTVAVLALAACGKAPTPASPTPASTALASTLVQAELLPRERIWDGVVEAVHEATLSAQTRGRVLELPFDVNDYVQAGAVVVRFTDVEQQSGRRRAEAGLSAARATLAEAEADHQRITEVYAKKLVAKAQLDQTTARRDSAKAAVAAASAAVREAGEQVDYTVIRAPYSGILTARLVKVGETVQPGQPLVSGLSMAQLRVNVEVPQSEISAIRAHAQAAVVLDDGRRIVADKLVIFPFADAQTHSFKLRLELPEAETGLQPGMTVKAAFKLGEQAQLRVAESTLVRRGELTGVYVIDADRVVLRQLRLGHAEADRVSVLSGLEAGERIANDPAAAAAYLRAGRQRSPQ